MDAEEQQVVFDYLIAFKDFHKVQKLVKENKVEEAKNLYWNLVKRIGSYAFNIHHEFTESDLEAQLLKSRRYDKPHRDLLKLYKDFSSQKFSRMGITDKNQLRRFLSPLENIILELQKIQSRKRGKHEHGFFLKPLDVIEEKIEDIKEKYAAEKEKIKKEFEKIHEPRRPLKKQWGNAVKSFLEYEEAKFRVRKRKRPQRKEAFKKMLKALFLKNSVLRNHEEHMDLFPFHVKNAILGKHHASVVYHENTKVENVPAPSLHTWEAPRKDPSRKFMVKLNQKKLREIELHENAIKRKLRKL